MFGGRFLHGVRKNLIDHNDTITVLTIILKSRSCKQRSKHKILSPMVPCKNRPPNTISVYKVLPVSYRSFLNKPVYWIVVLMGRFLHGVGWWKTRSIKTTRLVFVLVFKKTNTTGVVLIDRDFSPTDPCKNRPNFFSLTYFPFTKCRLCHTVVF